MTDVQRAVGELIEIATSEAAPELVHADALSYVIRATGVDVGAAFSLVDPAAATVADLPQYWRFVEGSDLYGPELEQWVGCALQQGGAALDSTVYSASERSSSAL